ncbi:hypothetical protein ACTQ3U_11135, partial [Oscillospiraceae bacterium LCP25S3_F9]
MKSINLGKISHTTISVLLILVLLVTSLPLTSMNTSAEAVSQTKYDNISDFQNARWTEIQNKVFGQNYTSVQPADAIKDLPVQQGNEFFNWTDTSHMQGYDNNGNEIDGGLQKYGTTTVTSMTSTSVTEKYADSYIDGSTGKTVNVTSSATYTVYNVYTADQFAWVLNQTSNVSSIKLNLLSDIDMGGADNKQFSTDKDLINKTLYIQGNGHTVYNLKIYGNRACLGLFNKLSGSAKLIVENFGFQSVMLLHYFSNYSGDILAGLFYGHGNWEQTNVSFENVHLKGAFFQQNTNVNTTDDGMAFFGGKGDYSKLFVNNCSISDGYIYGKNHVGGFFSFTSPHNPPKVRYDAEFPKNPNAFMFYFQPVFPVMINNSNSVNCEMFSTGVDSGAFISCGRVISANNCYTNNTIYANNNTGGFIGRVSIETFTGNNYDYNHKNTVGSVFKNCYSSGVVEGKVAMGGFVGYSMHYRDYYNTETTSNASFNLMNKADSTSVFINCYSTAMVGMDYTGKYCGGFIGIDDVYSQTGAAVKVPDDTIINNIYGNAYINCYAAGEVGNILTQNNINKSIGNDKSFFKGNYYKTKNNMSDYYPTGGFIGAINIDDYYLSTSRTERSNNTFGYFYNCYYDMQTTGMHEMAIGLAYAETCRDDASGQNARKGINADSKVVHKDANGNETPFSVIGITGVYTEKSDTKNVAGL